MKKVFLSFAFSIFFFNLFCLETPSTFREYTLSNGMSVFVYEDFSTPVVRIEYSAKAGLSMQTSNANLMPLYAELFSNAGKYSAKEDFSWRLQNLQAECNADSSRFVIEGTNSELKAIFEQLSVCAFAPIFSDDDLLEKINEIKLRSLYEDYSIETFINDSIDSRVFGNTPRSSNDTPSPLENSSLSELRAELMHISQRYYAPQNSAIFVSGAIKAKSVLQLAQETFGQYAAGTNTIAGKISASKSTTSPQRKFVLSDEQLSSDMAQIVAQYTSLSMEQADIAAIILNEQNSALKNSLTEKTLLNIRGSDYINADAAHKNGSSRLIIQTLLEKSNATAFEQSAAFEEILKQRAIDFTEKEFDSAKNFLAANFEEAISSSSKFMDLFSQFWAVDGLGVNAFKGSGVQGDSESLFQRFLMHGQNIMAETYEELKFVLQNEEPWIFILVNSNVFTPIKKDFAAAGFESVTRQEPVQSAKPETKVTEEKYIDEAEAQNTYHKKFIEQNKNAVKTARLSNDIRVTVKNNPVSTRAAIAFYAGVTESPETYGIASIVANLLEQNIVAANRKKIQDKELSQLFKVETNLNDTNFFVTIDCDNVNTTAALECIGQALLSSFTPVQVDIALAGRKAQQITKAAGLNTQLFAAGVRKFYRTPIYRSLFSAQKDILTDIRYNDALEAYQKLFNANRIEIIASGNIDAENFLFHCERVFKNLETSLFQDTPCFEPLEIEESSLKVKLTHTFLTDVSGDKAGPRPAILIPTTNFSDPVQYWIKSPQAFDNEKAIFDALLLELEEICKTKILVRREQKTSLVSFGAITFFNVQSLDKADKIFDDAIFELEEKIGSELDSIKARWIKEHYKNASENTTAVKIIAEKISDARLFGANSFDTKNAFTQDYQTVCFAETEDFESVFQKYFAAGRFKIYSADARK